jgi:hypothetical protein
MGILPQVRDAEPVEVNCLEDFDEHVRIVVYNVYSTRQLEAT